MVSSNTERDPFWISALVVVLDSIGFGLCRRALSAAAIFGYCCEIEFVTSC